MSSTISPRGDSPVPDVILPPVAGPRSFSMKMNEAIRKTGEVIKGIANFIFMQLIPGIFYFLPKAVFYELPRLLNRMHVALDAVEKMAAENKQVAVDTLALVRRAVAPVNQTRENLLALVDRAVDPANETREKLVVAVDKMATYVADGHAAADGAAAIALIETGNRAAVGFHAARHRGWSVLNMITKSPPKASEAGTARRRSSSGSVDSIATAGSAGPSSPKKPSATSRLMAFAAGMLSSPPPADASAAAPRTPPRSGAGAGAPRT
jgi:hypothetical protein